MFLVMSTSLLARQRYEHVYPMRLWDLHKIIQELLRSNKLPYVYLSVTFTWYVSNVFVCIVLSPTLRFMPLPLGFDRDFWTKMRRHPNNHITILSHILNFVTSTLVVGNSDVNIVIILVAAVETCDVAYGTHSNQLNRSSVDWTCVVTTINETSTPLWPIVTLVAINCLSIHVNWFKYLLIDCWVVISLYFAAIFSTNLIQYYMTQRRWGFT